MRVENFTVHNMSAPHKQGILQSKEKYNHLKPGPIEHNQGAE